MFTVYQKIITPESSPVLGPIPITNPNNPINPINTNNPNNPNNANNATNPINTLEPFSLCNYCCSSRNGTKNIGTKNIGTKNDINDKNNKNNKNNNDKKYSQEPDISDLPECKYEFGHATHYTYRITSPRILCEFETGTMP